jgi:hypothetical protein
MAAVSRFLSTSFQHQGTTLFTRLVTGRDIILNVMSAATLYQQIMLVLLNIGHILFGFRSIVLLTNTMLPRDVAVVKEWSHGIRDMLNLTMDGNFALSVWTRRSWTPCNANLCTCKYKISMKDST